MGRKDESHVLVTNKNDVRPQGLPNYGDKHTVDDGGQNPENTDEGHHRIEFGPPLYRQFN
jgi:hypothetical protein